MKQALSAWLQRRWYGGVTPEWPLRLLARWVERVARRRRRRFLRAGYGVQHSRLPVIVVGNLTVGGSGKTPLVLALIEALRARGWHPGVVSRSYGGRARRATRVRRDDDPRRVGDEPLLIAAASAAPVVVARRRTHAVRLIETLPEVDVILADDGLQHYALARDIEILVIDGRRRWGNARLLPAGPLREPLDRARDCDFRVVNGGETGEGEVTMRLELGQARALVDGRVQPLAALGARPLHAIAGIGDPERFFEALRTVGLEPVCHPFPDHHSYTPADLEFATDVPLLMTEKDAVKCAAFARPQWHAVPARARIPEDFVDALDVRLRQIAEPRA